MRLFPAAAVFVLCLSFGLLRARELKRRSRLLNELRQLILEIEVNLRYTAPTLDELSESCCGVFGELLRQERESSPDIKQAWKSAVERLSDCPFCGRAEAALLDGLGQALGTSDTEGQLSILGLHRARLERLCTEAEQEQRTKGKLYRSVSALLGAGIAVLII